MDHRARFLHVTKSEITFSNVSNIFMIYSLLISLNLTMNSIKDIDVNQFFNQRNLLYLNLSRNEKSYLRKGAFNAEYT